MLLVLSQSWAHLIGMLLLMIGNGLQGTLLGVRGSLENIDSSTMGYIMAGYFLGFLGGSRITPIMLQRVGHVRVFAALGSLVSAAFILYAAIVDPIAWWLLRVLVGFCFSGIYVVAESWLNDSTSNETRGQTLSLYLIVQMGGIVLGQLMLNVADPGGYNLFVLITVLVSISFAPMLLSSSPAPLHEASRNMSLTDLIKASPLACFGTLVMGGVFSVLFAMSPVYATERGLSIASTSYFVTAIFLGGLLFQYPIGWMSDRLDRRWLIIGLTAAGAFAAMLAMFLGSSLWVLYAVALLLGGCSNPLYSVLVAYANDYLDNDQMTAAAGGLLFINGLGAVSGPIVVGYAMSHFGIEWFFITLIVLLSAICLYGLYRMTQRTYDIGDDASPHLTINYRTGVIATELAIESADDAILEDLEETEEVWEPRPDDSEVINRLEDRSDN